MVDRYIDRPNSQYKNWIYGIVDHICCRIFVANYYLDYENKDENDVLGEEIKETPQGISETLPQSLDLMSSSEKLKLQMCQINISTQKNSNIICCLYFKILR